MNFRDLFKPKSDDNPASDLLAERLRDAQALLRADELLPAAEAYRSILESNVNQWDALNGLASTVLQLGDRDQAVRLYDKVLISMPDYALGHYKRANALNWLGALEAALAGYDRAIELEPGYANAYCNRGTVLERLNRLDEALLSYERTISLSPDDYLAYYNRGSVLKTMRRFDEALRSYDRAIALKENYAEAYINRGHVLQQLEMNEAAVESYTKAIELSPAYPEAFASRAFSLIHLKRHTEAIASFDRAIAIKPDYKYLVGMRRYAKMAVCDWRELADDLERLAQGLTGEMAVSHPFAILALFDSSHLHHLAAKIWVREECPANAALGEIVPSIERSKIRIGYFSADFRHHPVSLLTAELFETHDRSRFDVIGFAFGPTANDSVRARLKQAFDQFIDVSQLSDIEVASRARELSIDIAVDLGGFTDYSRTNIFAYRAAPVQISYVGYLGTMGASYVDYLVADPTIIPTTELEHFSEKIIYLPSYQVNDSKRTIADRLFTRNELGLPIEGFVFCCFNSNYKIMPKTFAAWMRILQRVPRSVFFLYAENALAAENLLKEALRHGIKAERIVFGSRLAMPDYLARYRTMDLFLDTLPYNAGATASDALWAGLPVLTCTSRAFAGRVAASLLNAIGLPELITSTLDEYEDLGPVN